MTTTGELRAIIQELHLVDVGDAESYLGEETMEGEESIVLVEEVTPIELVTDLLFSRIVNVEPVI